MTIRRILVPLTGATSDSASMRGAFLVAKAVGAHVDGAFLRPDPAEGVPFMGDAASASIIEDVYGATKAASDGACANAKTAMLAAAQRAGIPMVEGWSPETLPSAKFVDVGGGAQHVVNRKSRLSDLVVTSNLAKDPVALTVFETALLTARRPVLIAPLDDTETLGSTVLIAWNGSGEAADAIRAALPILKLAKSVTVLGGEGETMVPLPEHAVAYLGLHGVKAVHDTVPIKGKNPRACFLEKAAELDADLIVMGGYGHGRLREFLLGGVTRDMISNSEIALLMAH